MRYSIDWYDGASNRAPEERATVGEWRLWINDQNVTLHRRGTSSIDHVTAALYGLVSDLAHEWWSLFGGRDRFFSITKYRDGYLLPDVRFEFDGEIFEISAHQKVYNNPYVCFWAGPKELMARQSAELGLSNLINEVLARLEDRGVRDTSAALRWKRVEASRADPDEAAFCEAAGALGLDPYDVSEDAAASIERSASIFAGEPLAEFLAGAVGADRARLLGWIAAAEERPSELARVANLHSVAVEAARRTPARDLEPSWSRGYRRARAVREVMAVGVGHRFKSYMKLASALGATGYYEPASQVDGIRALRSERPDGTYIHMRGQRSSVETQSGYLFSFARAVGDAACFPETPKSAINELRSAYRQSAGRAFAAEFLAPIEEINSMREDGRDILSIADEFEVATTVVERQIENADRILAACA